MKRILFIVFFIVISFTILSFPIYADTKQKIYSINVHYKNGQTTIENIILKDGYPTAIKPSELLAERLYTIELRSFTNIILEQTKFNIATTIMPPPPLEKEPASNIKPVILNETETIINLIYHKDGKLLVLYGSDNVKIGQTDIGYLADMCGDKICQEHESFDSCPKDCPAGGKDDYCDLKNIPNDPDCLKAESKTGITDTKQKPPIFNSLVWWLVLGVFWLLLIIVGLIIYFRKKTNSPPDL